MKPEAKPPGSSSPNHGPKGPQAEIVMKRTNETLVELLAQMIDPEAFGLPNIREEGTITDRGEARDKARAIIEWLRKNRTLTSLFSS